MARRRSDPSLETETVYFAKGSTLGQQYEAVLLDQEPYVKPQGESLALSQGQSSELRELLIDWLIPIVQRSQDYSLASDRDFIDTYLNAVVSLLQAEDIGAQDGRVSLYNGEVFSLDNIVRKKNEHVIDSGVVTLWFQRTGYIHYLLTNWMFMKKDSDLVPRRIREWLVQEGGRSLQDSVFANSLAVHVNLAGEVAPGRLFFAAARRSRRLPLYPSLLSHSAGGDLSVEDFASGDPLRFAMARELVEELGVEVNPLEIRLGLLTRNQGQRQPIAVGAFLTEKLQEKVASFSPSEETEALQLTSLEGLDEGDLHRERRWESWHPDTAVDLFGTLFALGLSSSTHNTS